MKSKLNFTVVRNEFNNYSLTDLPKGYHEKNLFDGLTLKGLANAIASLVISEMEEPIF